MARKRLYRGFSSFEFQKEKSFSVNDIELVKVDLLNHIFTKRGERVMMPRFGTVIPELVFEPLDATTLAILDGELRGVFEYDPRVEIIRMEINPDYENNSINVEAVLRYIELNMTDRFDLHLEFQSPG